MKKRYILYDLSSTQASGNSYFHGGGEYAKTIFFKICEYLNEDVSVDVFYYPNKKIEESIIELCKKNNITVHYCNNHTDISNLLSEKKYDVFYSALPYSYYDLIIPPETKFVYNIFGLRALEYPADKYSLKYSKGDPKGILKHYLFLFFYSIAKELKANININNLNKLFNISLKKTIITISNHSKFSIAYFFPCLSVSEIKVFYAPLKKYDFDLQENNDILNYLSVESGKYILLILGNRSEKGAYRACRALNNLVKYHSGFPKYIKIIILGVTYKKHYMKLIKNNQRFIFHDYVSTRDLEILYKNAHVFLFPTLNEGFGYPPLEAMKYGTLCACSANSSLTEIYGDSVIYFNPFDEIEMANRILQCFDKNIRNEMAIKMSERFQYISKKQENDLDLLINEIIEDKE